MVAPKVPGGAAIPYTQMSRLAKARSKEYSIQSIFKYGYRNKEDISNLPPETLVVGSQNVLTNAAELVGIRQGYTLDGAAGNQNNYGIDSAYDFLTRNGALQNMRKWGGNMEVRYYNPNTKAVSWINILSTLNPANVVNFTNFWDQNTEQKMFCLFVNGNNNIYEWTGAVGSVASVSTATGIIASIITQPNSSNTTSGGTGYQVGDVLTISGGGGNATLTVGAISIGGVATYSIGLNGTGYAPGDKVFISSGSGVFADFTVATVNSGGGILTLTQQTAGAGFKAGVNYSVGAVTGVGTGAQFSVNSIGNTIAGWSLTANGTGYSSANNVATTGGSGTGATVSITAVGNNAIVVQGPYPLSQLGFYDNSTNSQKFQVLINGTTYNYTVSNANGGFTLVGITPTPTGISVGDAVIQSVFNNTGASVATNSSGNLGSFEFDLISTLENQIWYGSLISPTLYVSKTNDYQDVSFSSPARLPSEGALITLDAPLVGFSAQDSQMYATAGKDQWWVSLFNGETISNDDISTPTETLSMQRLKSAFNQAAQSQGLISRYKNSIIFVSNETIINAFGLVQNIQVDPQMTNMSDPIKYDVDAYNFTGGQILYDNYFIYVTIPKMGVVRMYNVVKQYWEAPQTLPVSRFYHVVSNGQTQLYGHSYLTNESYQLFTGYNDNGNPINAIASFAYTSSLGGAPFEKKNFNKFYTEGYISSNTTLLETINYDFGGFSGTYSVNISGSQAGNTKQTIFNKVTDGSLGQNTLGSQPVGTILNLPAGSNNPKFRIVNTMPRVNMFEYQPTYSSNDVDQQWTILRFGPAVNAADDIPTEITI